MAAKKKGSPDSEEGTESKRFADREKLYASISAVIPTIVFETETSAGLENIEVLESVLEDYQQTREDKNIQLGFTKEDDDREQVTTDISDEVQRAATRLDDDPFKWFEPFVLGAFVADAIDGKILLDEKTLRRMLFAIGSVKTSHDNYKRAAKERKEKNRTLQARRRYHKTRVDSDARNFYNHDYDMRELAETDEDKIKFYDILERMYRISKHEANKAAAYRNASTELARKHRLEIRNLKKRYYTLTKKYYKSEAAADKWLADYESKHGKNEETAKESKKHRKHDHADKPDAKVDTQSDEVKDEDLMAEFGITDDD